MIHGFRFGLFLPCVILVLMLTMYGATSNESSVSISKSGVLPASRGDIALIFYATVHNGGATAQIVRLSMVQCCLVMTDRSTDCDIIKLRNGISKSLHPNDVHNLTLYFVNKNLFGRVGTCDLKLTCSSGHHQQSSSGGSHQEFKIPFNTTFSANGPESRQSEQALNVKYCTSANQVASSRCDSGECILEYCGKRSFYNQKNKICESTSECSDAQNMMISPETNLCRKQYPSSEVLRSFTRDMREGITDSDHVVQPNGVDAAINVVCVHGSKKEDGLCKCDENWISKKFDPTNFDPGIPYQMCGERSSEGEIIDRTQATNYTLIALAVISFALIPCCAIALMAYCRIKKRKKDAPKSGEMSVPLLSDRDDKIISEVTSRREVQKSSNSHRSVGNNQSPYTEFQNPQNNDQYTSLTQNDQNHNNHSPFTMPKSSHRELQSIETRLSEQQLNTTSTNHYNSSSQSYQNYFNSPFTSKKFSQLQTQSRKSDQHMNATSNRYIPPHYHHHPYFVQTRENSTNTNQTRERIFAAKAMSDPNTYRKATIDLQHFDEVPLIDFAPEDCNNYAIRSKSAPTMISKRGYFSPELRAVVKPEGMTQGAQVDPTTTSSGAVILYEILGNGRTSVAVTQSDSRNESTHSDASETDVRASVQKKQELWAEYLRNQRSTESQPIRQHSEFGIQNTYPRHDSSQACGAKSVPMMSSTHKSDLLNNSSAEEPEKSSEYSQAKKISILYRADQNLSTFINADENQYESVSRQIVQSCGVERSHPVSEGKSANRRTMAEPHLVYDHQTAADRIIMSAVCKAQEVTSKNEQNCPSKFDRVDSDTLLQRNDSLSTLSNSSSSTSDIVVEQRFGKKIWVQRYMDNIPDDNVYLKAPIEPCPYEITSNLKRALRSTSSNSYHTKISAPSQGEKNTKHDDCTLPNSSPETGECL